MDLPSHVVPLSFDGADVQDYFARAAVLVTDYSSMAFNTAYMNRPVVYFQFDAARVMAGGHVGRAGYFEYERDGFGPVVAEAPDAVSAVEAIADNGYELDPVFQTRVEETFPHRDGHCCARVTAAIERLDEPFRGPIQDVWDMGVAKGQDDVDLTDSPEESAPAERDGADAADELGSIPAPDAEISTTEWSSGPRRTAGR